MIWKFNNIIFNIIFLSFYLINSFFNLQNEFIMKNLCTVEELEIVEIEIDEEIEKKNLKDFISTSLKLKNINLPKNKKIILNYIEELKTYQLILVEIEFKYLEIELFYKLYEQNNKNETIAFLYKIFINNFFLIKEINLSLQLYKLFLVIEIMQKSNFEFHKCFKSSKVLLENKYLLDKINIIDNLIENGNSINVSFCESKIFDDIVLNLINTGEVSNSLPLVVTEIKMIFKNRFDEKVSFLISVIQPIFLVFILILILWIVLAIFVPIWDMGNIIK